MADKFDEDEGEGGERAVGALGEDGHQASQPGAIAMAFGQSHRTQQLLPLRLVIEGEAAHQVGANLPTLSIHCSAATDTAADVGHRRHR